jgi:dTDP-4-dehydrorhamnose reductase
VRLLITGAGGQLGYDLQRSLAAHEIHPFDHRGLDIADRDAVMAMVERLQPDCIINAAAYNDVDRAESEPEAAQRVNRDGAGFLAEAALANRARLVHISTDYVFDGRKGAPYDEDDAPNPLGAYARSKWEGEQRVLEAGAQACVLRTAWLYGQQGKNFVKAILAAAEKGGPLRVVADQVGSPTATADLAQAIAALLVTTASGLFHVVNQGACSRFEFAQAIVRGRVEVLPITSADAARPAPRPAFSALASRRWTLAGLHPLRPWREALDWFLEHYRP